MSLPGALEEAASRPSLLGRLLRRRELERAEIDAWLARNPPPASWSGTPLAWAYEEMPMPPGTRWPRSIGEPAPAAPSSVAQDRVKATIAAPDDVQPMPVTAAAPAPAVAPPTLPRVAPSSVAREKSYTLVYGASGMGKTTLARAMYRARVERGGSAVFVDPKGENAWLGPRVVRSLEEFDRAWREQLRAQRQVALVFEPGGWDDDLNELWLLVYRIGDLLLVIDEADIYASTSRIDRNLHHLVGKGRFRQVDIVATVRTPPELNHQLTGSADVVVTFRQELPDYARVLADRFFPTYASAIARLPKFSYLRRGPDGKITRGVVRV